MSVGTSRELLGGKVLEVVFQDARHGTVGKLDANIWKVSPIRSGLSRDVLDAFKHQRIQLFTNMIDQQRVHLVST
jgi:hypothetical protein